MPSKKGLDVTNFTKHRHSIHQRNSFYEKNLFQNQELPYRTPPRNGNAREQLKPVIKEPRKKNLITQIILLFIIFFFFSAELWKN